MIAARRPHPALLGLLAITLIFGGVSAWRRMNRLPGRWVGYTDCSWFGSPRVTVRVGLKMMDSVAVVSHEAVHVAECKQLGPLRYRWHTLFASSNLALETPAYCAGARVRTQLSGDTTFARITTPIDMMAAMGDAIDSVTIMAALEAQCPEFVRRR